MEEKDKILKGLLFDGVITLQWSYHLLIIEERAMDGLGMCYLNQANTFFTCAKTLYYTHNYMLNQQLESLFFTFSRYNHELLNYVRKGDFVTSEVSKAYNKFILESKEVLNWEYSDLAEIK